MNIFRFLAILFNLSKKRRLEPPATLLSTVATRAVGRCFLTGVTPSERVAEDAELPSREVKVRFSCFNQHMIYI